jgi:hypothetical protein
MIIDAVISAKRILELQPGYSMSLRHLHALLVRELGPAAGSYGEIYQQLRRKSDCFAILNAPRMLGGESWPGAVREAYDSALENAGLGACARVTLTDPPSSEHVNAHVIAALTATLADITLLAEGDEALTAYLEAASLDLAQLSTALMAAEADLPTILLPDPPPAA